jgi:hypothetical protein
VQLLSKLERKNLQRSSVCLDAPTPLRLWHLASLDAPTVAVVWSLCFAWAAGVHLPRWSPLLVALGTWSVYVGDRILDAWKALGSSTIDSLRDRHFFHWRYRRFLIPLASGAALGAAALIVCRIPATVRKHDSVLGFAALAYFSGVHGFSSLHRPVRHPTWVSRLWSKELVVGVLFTAGCALPALSRLGIRRLELLLPVIGCFAALAWLNCSSIDRWESGATGRRGPAAVAIAGTAFVFALAYLPSEPRLSLSLIACAGSALLLALLDRQRSQFTPLALRCAADLVLLTPVVFLAL